MKPKGRFGNEAAFFIAGLGTNQELDFRLRGNDDRRRGNMKMGKNDPRSSMSKSVKGRSPLNPTGRNPIKSASPGETSGVGECCAPSGKKKDAPETDPVVNKSSGEIET